MNPQPPVQGLHGKPGKPHRLCSGIPSELVFIVIFHYMNWLFNMLRITKRGGLQNKLKFEKKVRKLRLF